MRTRKDAWKLSSSDKTLHWYAVAVSEMQSRKFANPLSWLFQAAVHGYDAGLYPPIKPGDPPPLAKVQTTYWKKCEHASWWFLPWHRIYVFLFEQMCLDIIRAKGGPEDWALPYWDYSHPKGTPERTMPDAFRNSTLGGAPNPLFISPRGVGVNNGKDVGSDKQSENTTCMKSGFYSSPTVSGFGGVTPPGPSSAGKCEAGPHNPMHEAIGGAQGWMDDTRTAALDPIFWLHHSNIDRLWVVWRNRDPGNVNPTDANWLDEKFDFYDNHAQPKKHKPSEVLETTGPLCDYVYEDTSDPLSRPVQRIAAPGIHIPPGATESAKIEAEKGGRGAESGEIRQFRGSFLEGLRMSAQRVPEMVGASKGPGVKLESSVQSVRVALRPPKRARRTPLRALESTGTQELPPRVHLNLENITAGERPIHTYEVYVDIPEGDSPAEHPELMAGLIPRFGLVEASQRDDPHGGQGLNYSFDITDIVSDLESRHAWNPENLTVTFAPHDMEEIAATRTEGRATAKRQPVEVGRVSLYYQ